MMRSFFLTLSNSGLLRRLATGFGPVRAMVRRFVAGETLDDAVAAVHGLNEQGLLATLDHLGENVTNETEARDGTVSLRLDEPARAITPGQSGVL